MFPFDDVIMVFYHWLGLHAPLVMRKVHNVHNDTIMVKVNNTSDEHFIYDSQMC